MMTSIVRLSSNRSQARTNQIARITWVIILSVIDVEQRSCVRQWRLLSLLEVSVKRIQIMKVFNVWQIDTKTLSNRPQVSIGYKLINHAGCLQKTRRIRKPRAAGEWFTNSSSVLPTSQVVYQPINHRNLWSIAFI